MKKRNLLVLLLSFITLLGIATAAWFATQPGTVSQQAQSSEKTSQLFSQTTQVANSEKTDEKPEESTNRNLSEPTVLETTLETTSAISSSNPVVPDPINLLTETRAAIPYVEDRNEEPVLQPAFSSVEIEGSEVYAGQSQSVRVRVKTENVPSGLPVSVRLLKANGEQLLAQDVNLNNNQAFLDLTLPKDLTAGDYIVSVKAGDLEKNLKYQVKERQVPELERVSLDRVSHIEGTATQVTLKGSTKHISDGTAVNISVTKADGSFLSNPINVKTQVQSNAFATTLTLPADLVAGEYRILVQTESLIKEQAYQVERKIEPQIKQLLVNSEQSDDDKTIIKVKADTFDIAEGAPAQIQLLQGDKALKTIDAKVQNKAVVAELLLDEALPDGEYRVVLTVNNLTSEKSLEIKGPQPPKVDPKFIKVVADKEEGTALTEDQIKLDIVTEGIDNNPEILVELLNADGTSVNPLVQVRGPLQGQTASLTLNLNDQLPMGTYQIKVSIPEYQLETKLAYQLNRKIVPVLKELSLNKEQSMEKSTADVTVTLHTEDIADDELIFFEVLDENGTPLLTRVTKETAVKGNRAEATLQMPDSLVPGKYLVRATYRTLQVEKTYEVTRLPQPEILEAKADKHKISYGYKEKIRIQLKLKDIEAGTDMKVVLRDDKGQPVAGYTEQLVKTSPDALEYTYELEPLNAGKYFIHVEHAGNNAVFTDIDLTVSNADSGWKDILDYSKKNDDLYWFDEFNRPYAYKDANAPFDPKKPTIIFVHGWQDGVVKDNDAPDFNYVLSYSAKEGNKTVKKEMRVNSAKAWVDAGYNVGVFNWVQIADEPGEGWFGKPFSAEAKIWVPNYTYYKRPMRYRLNNGKYIDEPNKTAADLFVEKYLDAMKGYQGDYVVFAGHSLGNQMVLRSTAMLLERVEKNEADRAIIPDRLTLMDPYYSGNSDRYAVYNNQKGTTSQAAVAIAKDLVNKNIVIDMFKSSELTTLSLAGDVNKDLENLAAYNRINPDMYGITEQANMHSAAYQFYYSAKNSGNNFYMKSDPEIASLMGSYFRIEQTQGKTTVDPSDDQGTIKTSGTYVPAQDILLKDNEGKVLDQTDKENPVVLNLTAGAYIRVDADVLPMNASSKVVVIEKVSGDMDAIQLAYDGYMKGIKSGNVLFRAVVIKRDKAGNITGTIEKYFRVEVK